MNGRDQKHPSAEQRRQNFSAADTDRLVKTAGSQVRRNPDTARSFGRSAGQAVSMVMGATQTTHSGQANAPTPSKMNEQLALKLGREVMQFKTFKAESMAVMLKPDKDTDIFLHFAMRNGGVDVQARFDRGDYMALNSQWILLQETMERQGVRLNSLEEPREYSKNRPSDSPRGHGRKRPRWGKKSAGKNFVETLDEKMMFSSQVSEMSEAS